jgi:hypothetical protein
MSKKSKKSNKPKPRWSKTWSGRGTAILNYMETLGTKNPTFSKKKK